MRPRRNSRRPPRRRPRRTGFIVVKLEGYATLVAERGCSLSGGERQRLSIARAMLKDAPILILGRSDQRVDNATEWRSSAR